MIASLPMYDMPEIREATDAWWRGLARHIGASVELDRHSDRFVAWRNPDLLFSQTCGYPLTHAFRGKLKLLTTPHYGVDGCEGPHYCSMIFARERASPEAMRGSTAAFNSLDSMSGMLALKLVFAPYAENGRFFARTIETGGHLRSLAALQEGTADVCAIDAVCVALAKRYRPELIDGLVEIARSPSVPALPFVTSIRRTDDEAARLRGALSAAFSDPELRAARNALFLEGASILAESDYARILVLEREMEKAGGLVLA